MNPISQCVGHIKLMDNVTYAERISGIFIGTGIRRERGREREGEREREREGEREGERGGKHQTSFCHMSQY